MSDKPQHQPDPATSQRFRRCMSAFPTGVTVVAVEHDGEQAGMTLNSFTSVSLTPLLVCISLAHRTRTLELVNRCGRFAVSILSAGQLEVAKAFAVAGSAFPAELTKTEDDGHLRVKGALAYIACEVSQQVQAGDHEIVIGHVTTFEEAVGEPLIFHGGAFGGIRMAHAA